MLLHWGNTDVDVRRRIRRDFAAIFNESVPYNAYSLLILMRSFAILALGIWMTTLGGAWIVVGFCLIGLAQYHLSVAVHEASHFGLFSPLWLNEAAAFLIGLTLGFGLAAYREHHMAHHRRFGLEDDPDRRAYQDDHADLKNFMIAMIREYTLIGLAGRVLRTLTNVALARPETPQTHTFAHPIHFAAMQAVIFVLFWWLYAWWAYITCWLLPLLVFPGLLNGLRMYGEHAGLDADKVPLQIFQARTTHSTEPVCALRSRHSNASYSARSTSICTMSTTCFRSFLIICCRSSTRICAQAAIFTSAPTPFLPHTRRHLPGFSEAIVSAERTGSFIHCQPDKT